MISTGKIKLIAIVNGVAAVLHLVFWILVFTRATLDPSEMFVTYGFGAADLLLSVPLLSIGSIQLYKQHFSGFLAAQMANALYWYSFTAVFFREINSYFHPGTLLFLPFALFSVWSAWYLWKVRSLFRMML